MLGGLHDGRRDAGGTGNMHRLTARILLLFVLVGNFVPLALAVAAGQGHACCVRKAAHPCHGGAIADSSRLSIHDAGCCRHRPDPGADRTNSMAMITDYVPGAYMTHDMLHMRGGHQVSWLIDGVEIPNTNIASNLGAQIDPKDIDYLEVQRGSYTSDVGDRTYGVFNVVPRTGFERDRQAELVLSAGNFYQTNDQINFGDHTEKFAYYASLNGNRSDYGLAPPIGQVFHDAANGYGGFASLIYKMAMRLSPGFTPSTPTRWSPSRRFITTTEPTITGDRTTTR
jgi:hypothetical protein